MTPLRAHRDSDPELIRTMRAALRSDEPLDLLITMSGLMQVAGTPGGTSDGAALPSLDFLVDSFIDAPYAETTAALHVIRALTPDPGLAHRIDAALAQRQQPMPTWLPRLHEARPRSEVWTLTDALGDGDDYFIPLDLDDGHSLTCVVYVDHNLGTVVKDAFVVPVPISTVLDQARQSIDDAAQTLLPFDPATARAIIERAERDGDLLENPLESDTWPMHRPLVDWFVRLLPEGGRAPEILQWTDDELEAVVDAFVDSSYGDGYDTVAHLDLLDYVVSFAVNEGPGDPLRWSGVSVELLLAYWFPHAAVLPLDTMLLLPDTLRQFIRYSHDLRGIGAAQRAETMESVDRWVPAYLAQVEANATAGVYDGLVRRRPSEIITASLERAVGGREILLALGTEPLPDEAFDWNGVPDDLRDVVAAILSDCDRVADELLTVEHRTAMRRLLHRIAVDGPAPLRRRAATNRSAAAIAWLINCANDTTGIAQVPNSALFKVLRTGTVHERASSFVKAIGLPPVFAGYQVELDSADYLVSTTRAGMIALRDLYEQH